MKALTISQPYASLIADGEKPVENRRWDTGYRGSLAIHAGKGTQYMTRKELREVPSGVVIATCTLLYCCPVMRLENLPNQTYIPYALKQAGWALRDVTQLLQHEHCKGPYLWILGDITKLSTPIPAVGKQGLWEFEYPEVTPC